MWYLDEKHFMTVTENNVLFYKNYLISDNLFIYLIISTSHKRKPY